MQRKGFLILGLVVFVMMGLLLTYNSKKHISSTAQEEQQVAATVVYSTLPANINQIIANHYNNHHQDQVEILNLTSQDLKDHVDHKRPFPKGQLVLGFSYQLESLAEAGLLKQMDPSLGEAVPQQFRNDHELWLGTWFDPVVFCYNRDYVKANWTVASTWSELKLQPKLRITTMDFLNTAAGANILYALAEERGPEQALNILKGIHPQVVRYAKYLSSPVRMVGMGEADMSIAMLSEVLKYRNDKYPLAIVYPQDGTAYLLAGVGLLGPVTEGSKEFINYLLQDDVQIALQNQQLYFIPTNEDNLTKEKYSQGKLPLLKQQIKLDEQRKIALLNRWVKEVRLGN